MAAAASNGSAAAVNGMRSASSIHAIQSASVPGPRETLPRRCSRLNRLRPPLPHHPSSAVSGATHTARECECAPPCVKGYGRLRHGRGTTKEGTRPRSSGGGSRKSHSALHRVNSGSTPRSAHQSAAPPHHSLLSSHAHRRHWGKGELHVLLVANAGDKVSRAKNRCEIFFQQ